MSFRRVGAGLEGMVAEWLEDSELNERLVQQAWRKVVGETAAARSRVVDHRDGTLRVRVLDLTWERSLQAMEDRLLLGLRDALGKHAPRRIEWV